MDRLVKSLLRIYFRIFYRVEIKGMENIPEKGGLILCANHVGELDMFFIGYKMKRLVHFMAKAELFESSLLAWFFRGVGAFPVKRGTGDIGAAKAVYKLLRDGKIVGILPEGTRTRGKDMKDIKVKGGAALFAHSAGVPILPAGVKGSYKLFSRVKVVFGKPYLIEGEQGRKLSAEELQNASDDIMHRIYKLLEEA